MLITAFLQFRPEGHREPRNEVGFLSLAEHLMGPGTFQFFLQHHSRSPFRSERKTSQKTSVVKFIFTLLADYQFANIRKLTLL